jgi:hypothetical protein
MSNFFRKLKAAGMTNMDQGFTISDITSRSSRSIGECLSQTTSIETRNGKNVKYYPCGFKTTDVEKDDCPVCGHALFWRPIG